MSRRTNSHWFLEAYVNCLGNNVFDFQEQTSYPTDINSQYYSWNSITYFRYLWRTRIFMLELFTYDELNISKDLRGSMWCREHWQCTSSFRLKSHQDCRFLVIVRCLQWYAGRFLLDTTFIMWSHRSIDLNQIKKPFKRYFIKKTTDFS